MSREIILRFYSNLAGKGYRFLSGHIPVKPHISDNIKSDIYEVSDRISLEKPWFNDAIIDKFGDSIYILAFFDKNGLDEYGRKGLKYVVYLVVSQDVYDRTNMPPDCRKNIDVQITSIIIKAMHQLVIFNNSGLELAQIKRKSQMTLTAAAYDIIKIFLLKRYVSNSGLAIECDADQPHSRALNEFAKEADVLENNIDPELQISKQAHGNGKALGFYILYFITLTVLLIIIISIPNILKI